MTQCTGELSYRIPGALRGPSGHAREMVRFDPIQPCAARVARPTARPHGRCQPMADHGAERASSAAGSSRKPTNDAGARKNASSSKVCAAGWHQAAAQGMAGGCGIVSSALAAVTQPLCWIFGVHCIKHAVRLRCSCLWSTSRCAPQRRALQLHHAADGSGDGPLGVLNGTVAAGSSRSLPGFGLVRLYLVYLSYGQILAEYRVAMCQCDSMA